MLDLAGITIGRFGRLSREPPNKTRPGKFCDLARQEWNITQNLVLDLRCYQCDVCLVLVAV
jgi:hypothetical protein